MKLNFDGLSYWEKKWLIDDIDFTIIGAGIVGLSAAFHLKKKHPKAKILILDKGVLPFSASSKNAGFTCFGSPSEILDDLENSTANEVWETVEMRWKGLLALQSWLGASEINLQTHGSWDLIGSDNQAEEIRDQLSTLNKVLKNITGESNIYSEDISSIDRFGFEKLSTSFNNRLEGQLDTSMLIQRAIQRVEELQIPILRGTELKRYTTLNDKVEMQTNFGEFSSKNLILCTNGFTSELETKWDINPARAQVLITKKIEDIPFKGTFHIDRGYYYFRNIDDRLLIGGGRNINFQNEETTQLETTHEIQAGILEKINQIIFPKRNFEIAYSWAGIMGVGSTKKPIIERIDSRVCVGIRMGGMGVAIGTLVGQKLAQLHP